MSFLPFLSRKTPSFDPTAPLLEIQDLYYTVRNDARKKLFRGVDFSLRKHELVLVVGENGVGKSTLFSLIMGFTPPNSGTFLWRGVKLRKGERRLHIAMAMQRPADFFLGRSVLEELTLGYFEAKPEDVRSVLFSVGLDSISLMKKPKTLSGGQQKRLAIAGQLMRTRVGEVKPEVFLLDEPMAGVDATGRRELAELLRKLTENFAVVVISHEPSELLDYCDRVVQLAHGQLHEVDPAVLQKARALKARQAAESERNEG